MLTFWVFDWPNLVCQHLEDLNAVIQTQAGNAAKLMVGRSIFDAGVLANLWRLAKCLCSTCVLGEFEEKILLRSSTSRLFNNSSRNGPPRRLKYSPSSYNPQKKDQLCIFIWTWQTAKLLQGLWHKFSCKSFENPVTFFGHKKEKFRSPSALTRKKFVLLQQNLKQKNWQNSFLDFFEV